MAHDILKSANMPTGRTGAARWAPDTYAWLEKYDEMVQKNRWYFGESFAPLRGFHGAEKVEECEVFDAGRLMLWKFDAINSCWVAVRDATPIEKTEYDARKSADASRWPGL